MQVLRVGERGRAGTEQLDFKSRTAITCFYVKICNSTWSSVTSCIADVNLDLFIIKIMHAVLWHETWFYVTLNDVCMLWVFTQRKCAVNKSCITSKAYLLGGFQKVLFKHGNVSFLCEWRQNCIHPRRSIQTVNVVVYLLVFCAEFKLLY